MRRSLLVILCLWCLLTCALPLCAQDDTAAPPSTTTTTVTPQEARARLDNVLSRREFRGLKRELYPPNMQEMKAPNWWQRFWNWVWQGIKAFFTAIGNFFKWVWQQFTGFLKRLSPPAPPPPTGPAKTGWLSGLSTTAKFIIWVVVIALVLWLVGLLVSRIMLIRRRREAPEGGKGEGNTASPVSNRKQEPTYWERALAQAEEMWQQGEEREAVRVLQRACLVLLDARGMLRYDETRANGEVLRELRRQGKAGVSDALRPIVRTFDRGWYGFLPISSDEFSDVLAHSRRFRETVIGGSNG